MDKWASRFAAAILEVVLAWLLGDFIGVLILLFDTGYRKFLVLSLLEKCFVVFERATTTALTLAVSVEKVLAKLG